MRKVIYGIVKICQMLPDPVQGTTSGGNRCEPTCAAIFDCTYKIGPSAKEGKDPQLVMQDFARWRNNGNLSGGPEPAWLGDWLKEHSNGAISLEEIPSTFEAIALAIDAGLPIYTGLDRYMAQLDALGNDPYVWKEDPTLPEGHIEIISGYDDNYKGQYGQVVVVNDPLQGTAKQPSNYRFSSLVKAGLHLYRLHAPALAVTDESPEAPVPDQAAQLADALAELASIKTWLAAAPKIV